MSSAQNAEYFELTRHLKRENAKMRLATLRERMVKYCEQTPNLKRIAQKRNKQLEREAAGVREGDEDYVQ